jgi:integrase
MNDLRKLQTGSVRHLARANGKWAWEWRYVDPATGGVKSRTFTGTDFPTLTKIEEHLADFIERLNKARTEYVIVDPTISSLLDRYIDDERLNEIKNRKPGERAPGKDELAYSTVTSYLSLCKLIRENWGTTSLDKFKPLAFQTWLKEMEKSPKHKGHIKAFVNRLFNKAKLYELINFHENPISLVEVRGISKRRRKPADLTVEQFFMIHSLLKKPYNDMSMVALCTGIRVEELLALQWSVIDFNRLCLKIEEGVVNGRIGPVKSEYSGDELPLDPDFATFLLKLERNSNARPCYSRARLLDTVIMPLRSSRTGFGGREGVWSSAQIAELSLVQPASWNRRTVENDSISRFMMSAGDWQSRRDSAVSDGTLSATPTDHSSS